MLVAETLGLEDLTGVTFLYFMTLCLHDQLECCIVIGVANKRSLFNLKQLKKNRSKK